MTLRLDDDDAAALKAMADRERVSLNEIVRRAILEPAERNSMHAAVQASAFGAYEAYPTLGEKAAALLHSIVRNHALVDGNKRLAWTAVVIEEDGCHRPNS